MRTNGLPWLTDEEQRALNVLVTRLRQEYPTEIAQVILFGSRARGDASRESDFDLLIVTKNGSKRLKETVDRLVKPVGFEHHLVFSPYVITQEEFATKRTREPFYRSIASEGIELNGKRSRRLSSGQPLIYRPPTRGFQMDENARIQIKIRLERAHQELSAAHLLLKEGLLPIAVSRGYYAVFNLTTAVLLTLDLIRTKHTGVESAFIEYFIKPKRLEEEYKDIFVRAKTERELADYKFKQYSEGEVRQILADCERFIARMEKYLQDVGATGAV